MTLQDYKSENFTQAQEEAAAAVEDALETLAGELGIGNASAFAQHLMVEIDVVTRDALSIQEMAA